MGDEIGGSSWRERPAHYRLDVWQEAMALVNRVYRATANMPRSEQYNLTRQIQRSAVSVPSNIAEGAGRGTRADFARFLSIATGSLMELDTQLMIAMELDLLEDAATFQQAISRLFAKLNRLIETQRSREP